MEEIINFIKDHQMLSGSIGVIVVAIISFFISSKSKGSVMQKQKNANNSKGYQAGGDININEKK
ncbi:hypothetical protein [Sphingobacterium sp. MYb388]|uniref:hypothetical protein n=1 Tax=Sphingobacterium sp. MYb388 TaxID=2745437 RepID=UPI0030A7BB6E